MSNTLLQKVLSGSPVAKEETQVVHNRTNLESRKKAWTESIESFDVDRLIGIQEEMDQFIDLMKTLSKTGSDEVVLAPQEAVDLMKEYLSNKNIAEFLEARKAMVREMVFLSIEEKLREEGVEDPVNTNGSIEVPSLGKKFCKEGAGYKDPVLDMAKLKSELGSKFDKVVVKKVIPEQVVEEVSEDLLVELAQNDPEVLKAIQESVVNGKPKSAKFVVRNMS